MRSSSQSCETDTLSTRCRFTAASFCSAVWYDRVVSDMAGYLRPGYITRSRVAVHFRLRQDSTCYRGIPRRWYVESKICGVESGVAMGPCRRMVEQVHR